MAIITKKLSEVSPPSKEDLERIDAISDEDIDFSDIPELDEDFFENSALVIRISNGIKITIDPITWHALARTKEGLEYHIDQIKSALKNYSGKKIA